MMDWLMLFGIGMMGWLMLVAHLWTHCHFKRKLAQEKERLDHVNNVLVRLTVNYRTLYEEMCQWDNDICGMLGETSAFRRHTTKVDTDFPIREVPIYPKPSAVPYDDDEQQMVDVSRERMYRFMITIETRFDTLQRFIRFDECDGRTGARVLAVSESLFDLVGFGDREYRWVVEDLARRLLQMFRKENERVI